MNRIKNALLFSSALAASLLLSACGSESDDNCVITTDENGANSVVCDGGTQVSVPRDKVKSITKILASGEVLVLEHGFSIASASAQYVEHNNVLPVSNYPATHSPKVGDAVADFSSNGRLTSHDGFLLSNGNYALVNYENFMIINPQGEELLAMSSPDVDGKDACSMHGAAVKDIGFVLAYTICNEDQKTLLVKRFDLAGADIGFDDGSSIKTISSDLAYGLRVSSVSDGGFAISFVTNISETNDSIENQRNLLRFNAAGEQQGELVSELAPYSSSYIGLAPLADGALLWVSSFDLNPSDTTSKRVIQASVVSAAGIESKTQIIGGTYLGDVVKTARADNGNVMIAYELGGPDAMAYAVFNAKGELIAGPTTITGHEPDFYSAGVFGDGDFVLAMGEDESEAGLMWNINNQGQLMHSDSIKFGHGWEPDYRFSIFPVNDFQVNLVYEAYSDPSSYMQTVAKNYLPVKKISEAEVSVTNWSAQSVEVVLTAWETQAVE